MLVQAVNLGEWTAIENANLCSPSVLDRLNGLFEEGACSLTINEQGLVKDRLREVRKHANFRAVFVVSEKTLLEQGKDVSKALKNRCLEVSVHYGEDTVGRDFDMLDEAKVFSESAQLSFSLASLQNKHDLLPTTGQSEPNAIQLGKRQSPEAEAVTLRKIPVPELPVVIQNQYPFYLPLLESDTALPHEDFLRAQIKGLQGQLSEQIQSQILDNQLSRYLT